MDISIVIPVYNVEKYLARCLDSVFNQNFDGSFEVIAVNDGSTDKSLDILHSYAKRFNSLTIINQEKNKSLAVARRTGIHKATGVYIVHIDSDDWIEDNMLMELWNEAKENNFPDVLVYDYQRHNGIKSSKDNKRIYQIEIFDETNKIEIQSKFFMGACWNKMVKRELLVDMVYGKHYINSTEDLIYSFEVFLQAKSILLVPNIYYNYFHNQSSLTTTITPEQYIKSQIIICSSLYSIFFNKEPKYIYKDKVIKYFDKWIVIELFRSHIKNKISEEIFFDFYEHYQKLNNNHKYIKQVYGNCVYSFIESVKLIGLFNVLKLTIKQYI